MNSLWRSPIPALLVELQRDINRRISDCNQQVAVPVTAEPEPMLLAVLFGVLAADAARRLDTFEQQLQRRRIVQEHEAAELARRVAKWDAVEAGSPYRSGRVH